MQISLHLGAHLTDEERLSECLVKNSARLAEEGIAVPAPAAYRQQIRDAQKATDETATDPALQSEMIRQIDTLNGARRVVMSWQGFLSGRGWAISEGMLYPGAGKALLKLRRLFGDHQVEAAMAIRNPATFMASLVHATSEKAQARILNTARPETLRWSETIERMRAECPDVPLTLWCDEDTPFLWHDILRAVSGHSPAVSLEHTYDWFAQVMTAEGLDGMLGWLESHPPVTEEHRRRVISAFLDKFYDAEKVDVDMDLPGWTAAMVEEMTELYETDVTRISAIPGVRLLKP